MFLRQTAEIAKLLESNVSKEDILEVCKHIRKSEQSHYIHTWGKDR